MNCTITKCVQMITDWTWKTRGWMSFFSFFPFFVCLDRVFLFHISYSCLCVCVKHTLTLEMLCVKKSENWSKCSHRFHEEGTLWHVPLNLRHDTCQNDMTQMCLINKTHRQCRIFWNRCTSVWSLWNVGRKLIWWQHLCGASAENSLTLHCCLISFPNVLWIKMEEVFSDQVSSVCV